MSGTFQPGTAAQPSILVELTISCRDLIRMDLLSKSDPMCVTYIKPFLRDKWEEYHRTECIPNCHDPDFTKKLKINYRFEEQQHLKFRIVDVDSASTRIEDHDFLGEAECTLGRIVSGVHVKIPLKGEAYDVASRGHILITAEEASDVLDEVTLQFSAENLDSKSWFGATHPFLIFSKSTESGEYSVVHKTEVKHWTRNPVWKKFVVPVAALCGNDWDRSIKIACWHRNNSNQKNLIGKCHVTLKGLSAGADSIDHLVLVNPNKQNEGKNYKSSGRLKLLHYSFNKRYSMLDYIRGGTQLNCSFAIDFTASNGNPMESRSLHYISNVPNQYEQAIISVGGIIQDYDSDKQFPVLGFGAKIPPTGQVSHEFFVNFQPGNPYCEGINGVLQAYRSCISRIQLFGPTNFSPVIKHVAKFAAHYRDGSHYFILLIITDGEITDLDQTKEAIIDASFLPLSIIIVGVGGTEFNNMDALDSDDKLLSVYGKRAVRDIVQFVPFSKFKPQSHVNVSAARASLAREVLAEIPNQFLGYMRANNVVPKETQQVDAILLPPDPCIMLTNV